MGSKSFLMKYILFLLIRMCLICLFKLVRKHFENDLYSKVDNLDSTDDRKPSEETHCSSNGRQHVHKLGCPVLGDSVKGCGIKINPHKSQFQIRRIVFLKEKQNILFFEQNSCLPLNSPMFHFESILYIFLNFL